MRRVTGIVRNVAEVSVCKLWDSSSHEMVKIERYSTIGYSFVPKWIKSVVCPEDLGNLGKIHTHGSQDAKCLAQVESMPHVLCWRANHSPQSHQREQHAEVGKEIVNNTTLDLVETWLTEIVLWAFFLWSNTALTMQFTEGSKNEATSVLNKSC